MLVGTATFLVPDFEICTFARDCVRAVLVFVSFTTCASHAGPTNAFSAFSEGKGGCARCWLALLMGMGFEVGIQGLEVSRERL